MKRTVKNVLAPALIARAGPAAVNVLPTTVKWGTFPPASSLDVVR